MYIFMEKMEKRATQPINTEIFFSINFPNPFHRFPKRKNTNPNQNEANRADLSPDIRVRYIITPTSRVEWLRNDESG
jgi:hypothetical protein